MNKKSKIQRSVDCDPECGICCLYFPDSSGFDQFF